MTKKKTTKKALLASALSLLLCFSMLLGTTYAWFTDSVTSENNIIKSGNLDVTLEYWNGTEWKTVEDASDILAGNLWEPGYVDVAYLRVKNAGSLALKYNLGVNIVSETSGVNKAGERFTLSDYIYYDVEELAVTDTAPFAPYASREAAMAIATEKTLISAGYSKSGTLLPTDGYVYLAMVVYMPTTVDNVANHDGKTIPEINLGINVMATQLAAESDSFGNGYDEDAFYYDALVATDAELKAAIEDADVKTIAIDGDLTYDWGGNSYGNSEALKMKGKTLQGFDGNDSITFAGYGSANPIVDVTLKNITVKDATVGDDESAWEHGYLEFESLNAKNVVFADSIMLDGNSTLTNCSMNNTVASWYGIWIEGGNTVLKDCSFSGTRSVKIHEAYGSEVESVLIDNCIFGPLSEKPGVVIGALNAATSVTIKNSTFAKVQAGDQDLYIYETDTAVDTFNFVSSNNTISTYVEVNSATELAEKLTGAGAAGSGNTVIQINTDLDMTGVNWTPIKVDGYHGADIVTVDGQGHTITGLSAPLFAGGFAGGSGIVIKNLTISDSEIVSTSGQGSGAFIQCVDSMNVITLTNCHLKNSTLNGSRTGGLIGWTAGYNNVNDGPVKLYVTVEDCSVVGCEINGSGSVGGIIGHSGGNAWTYTIIKNCLVKDCELNSTDSGDWRTGVAIGTVNVGEQNDIINVSSINNTLTQTGKTAPDGQSNLYGRFVPGTTGKLTIDGVEIN
ncbi:MAG: SipW-dependent-type signal peptide-containing protein [Clostridia bacterium]|nr:SipW-dependent-type signal peptide-containing protein [Clostridia bacterium]